MPLRYCEMTRVSGCFEGGEAEIIARFTSERKSKPAQAAVECPDGIDSSD